MLPKEIGYDTDLSTYNFEEQITSFGNEWVEVNGI